MALCLDAPIEELKLSKRVRNVLHLSGLHTIRSLLECDYKTALRRFGPTARAEVACALEVSGFSPPANLTSSQFDDFNADLSKLYAQVETSCRKWSAQLAHYETRIRELTEKARSDPGRNFERNLFSQELMDRLSRLARTVLVFDERETHVPFAHRPESDAWRHRHQRLFHQ